MDDSPKDPKTAGLPEEKEVTGEETYESPIKQEAGSFCSDARALTGEGMQMS